MTNMLFPMLNPTLSQFGWFGFISHQHLVKGLQSGDGGRFSIYFSEFK